MYYVKIQQVFKERTSICSTKRLVILGATNSNDPESSVLA